MPVSFPLSGVCHAGVPGLEVRPVVLAPQNSFHEDTAAATPGTEEEAKANEQSKIQQAAEGASRAVATKAYTAERRVPFAMEQLESQRLIRIEGSTPKQEDARAETKQAEKRGGRSSADKETKEMQKSSGFATRPVFSPFDIKGFRPALARPTPPLLDMSSDEVAWWQPMGAMELLWDPEVGGGNANVATARRLMLKGFAGPLNSEDTEVRGRGLTAAFKQSIHPSLFLSSSLLPPTFALCRNSWSCLIRNRLWYKTVD